MSQLLQDDPRIQNTPTSPKEVILTIKVATIDAPITNEEEIQSASQEETTKMVGTSARCAASFAMKKVVRKPIAHTEQEFKRRRKKAHNQQ